MTKKDKDKTENKADAGGEAEQTFPVGGAVGAKVVFAAVVVAVVVVGMYLLRQSVLTSSTRPSEGSVRVHLADPPKWLPRGIAEAVVADIQSAVQGSGVLDDNLARNVFDAAAKNPWIAKVYRVTRQNDGTVLVRADFRRPFAMVAFTPLSPADVRVVDADGVVLPLPPRPPNAGDFVRILEITTDPPPAGKKWDSLQLADALKLLGLIKDKPYISQINPIEIKIINARTHLIMHALAGGG
ncbi:MAG: hypothetical protein K8R91_03315, partial [Phycisphaerae bacterium]|nr:hypothetical protein [Phycisphaerae bacterium]